MRPSYYMVPCQAGGDPDFCTVEEKDARVLRGSHLWLATRAYRLGMPGWHYQTVTSEFARVSGRGRQYAQGVSFQDFEQGMMNLWFGGKTSEKIPFYIEAAIDPKTGLVVFYRSDEGKPREHVGVRPENIQMVLKGAASIFEKKKIGPFAQTTGKLFPSACP